MQKGAASAAPAPLPEQVALLLDLTRGTKLEIPVLLAVGLGLRRGEILALTWDAVQLDAGLISVCQATEQTKAGVRFKAPKSQESRRTAGIPDVVIEALRRHEAQQAEHRLRVGPEAYQNDNLVVANEDGSVVVPERLTGWFRDFIKKHPELPRISFHALRHTAASLLIREGVHARVISGILGHSDIRLTMNTYGHLLPGMQTDAAKKMNGVLRGGGGVAQEG